MTWEMAFFRGILSWKRLLFVILLLAVLLYLVWHSVLQTSKGKPNILSLLPMLVGSLEQSVNLLVSQLARLFVC